MRSKLKRETIETLQNVAGGMVIALCLYAGWIFVCVLEGP